MTPHSLSAGRITKGREIPKNISKVYLNIHQVNFDLLANLPAFLLQTLRTQELYVGLWVLLTVMLFPGILKNGTWRV